MKMQVRLIQFRGVQASRQASQTYLSGVGLRQALLEERTAQSNLPESLQQDHFEGVANLTLDSVVFPSSQSRQEVVNCLNQLASLFCPFQLGILKEMKMLPDESQKSEVQLLKQFPVLHVSLPGRNGQERLAQLKLKGFGHFGLVFKLTVDDCDFAFKCFYPAHRELMNSGPYGEAAMAAYLAGKDVSNMPRLVAANPEAGWQLCEWVDQTWLEKQLPQRKGPAWQSLGLTVLDSHIKENEVSTAPGTNPVRLDYGHMNFGPYQSPPLDARVKDLFKTREESGYVSAKAYLALFESTPTLRTVLAENLMCLDPQKKVNILKTILVAPELKNFSLSDLLSVTALSPAQIEELLPWLMAHPRPEIQNMTLLPLEKLSPDAQGKLRQFWATSPAMAWLDAVLSLEESGDNRKLQKILQPFLPRFQSA
jgi:hypothetical protein